MITEDYVSFETAKLLKEKGFNEHCKGFYVNSGVLSHTLRNTNNSKWDEDKSTIGYISAPTLQMTTKWLREVHYLHVCVGHSVDKGLPWYYEIHGIFDGKGKHISGIQYGSYEVACEAAIKYCLEDLI